MPENMPDNHDNNPAEFDRIVGSMDEAARERFDRLNRLDPDTYLKPQPEDMPPVFEVRRPINSYEEWKTKRDRYAARINRIQEICARTGSTDIMNTQWYGVLLGKYVVYDQQTRGLENLQTEQEDI